MAKRVDLDAMIPRADFDLVEEPTRSTDLIKDFPLSYLGGFWNSASDCATACHTWTLALAPPASPDTIGQVFVTEGAWAQQHDIDADERQRH